MKQHNALNLLLTAFFLSGLAFSQDPTRQDPNRRDPTNKDAPTKTEVAGALQEVESLTRDLVQGLDLYRKRLKKAMEIYGGSFYDPQHKHKLAGFGSDIQTGDVDQTAAMKLALFTAMLRTAGIRLDPDPFRDWAAVEALLDRYDAILDRARSLMLRTNLLSATGPDQIAAKTLVEFRRRWRAAAREAEKARDKARSSRPRRLEPGETFEVRAAEGRNLHFDLFGLQFGNDLGNVVALARLTYSGRIEPGDLFLLTVLAGQYTKTRVDTVVKPRAVLVYSDARNPLLYGHAVTAHSYAGYSVLGERISSVSAHVRDWVWKDLPASLSSPPPSLPELEEATRRVKESHTGIDRAIRQYQRLASESVRQNDEALKRMAKGTSRKARLPEQDLAPGFPDIRARLYASRALRASDRRFLAALENIDAARREAGARIAEARELFSCFNAVPVLDSPEQPWKRVEKLALDLMIAAEEAQRAGASHDPDSEGTVISRTSLPPNVLVVQESRGRDQVVERIMRDVHWAIKGIDRREYSSELIKASPLTGIHEVQQFRGPDYVQGPGGIIQTFRRIAENGGFAGQYQH